MRERVVERYLHTEVVKAGGATRKHKGRTNDPDRIVIWPALTLSGRLCGVRLKHSEVHFIETKAPGKKARRGQAREHARLRKFGCVVLVLDTREKIDNYIEENRR